MFPDFPIRKWFPSFSALPTDVRSITQCAAPTRLFFQLSSHQEVYSRLCVRGPLLSISVALHAVAKLCPTTCNPRQRLPGSLAHGTSQARRLEWAAISFSRASSQLRDEPTSPALAGAVFATGPPGKPLCALSLPYSHPSLQLAESPPPDSTSQLKSYLLPEALKLITDCPGHSRSSNLVLA